MNYYIVSFKGWGPCSYRVCIQSKKTGSCGNHLKKQFLARHFYQCPLILSIEIRNFAVLKELCGQNRHMASNDNAETAMDSPVSEYFDELCLLINIKITLTYLLNL